MSIIKVEKKPTILIADDDSSTRMLLRATISQWDYPVLEASDGEEAWEVIIKEKPQIVTVDWMMPKIDGLGLCTKTKELHHPPYMILLTSMSGTANIVHALESGADDFLTKPFNYAELRSRLFVGHRIVNFTNKLKAIMKEEKKNDHQINKKVTSAVNKITRTTKRIQIEWDLFRNYLKCNNGTIPSKEQLVLQKMTQGITLIQEQLAQEIKWLETLIMDSKGNAHIKRTD